jgi:hypothetical protein
MFNFETNISDHPTLAGVKRRFINTGHTLNDVAKQIRIEGKVFYFRPVNAVETPINEIGAQGFIEFNITASNKNTVDATGTRVSMIPEETAEDGTVTPAHFPDGSKGEYDYWLETYYDLVKTQGEAVAIFDLFNQQILLADSKGFFNL